MEDKKDPNHLNLHFLSNNDILNDIAYVNLNINVEVTQQLLMFHVCHLYINCFRLLERKEINESDFDKYINLRNVLLSLEESLKQRIQTGSCDYIDESFVLVRNNNSMFDECLGYFQKVNKEFQEAKQRLQERKKIMDDFVPTLPKIS